MAEANPIPAGPHELSAEGLTAMLRGAGVIDSAAVVGFESEVLGQGEGFIGVIVRLALSYDCSESAAPATLIGKFPTDVDQNRGIAESGGAYEKEIRFYRHLADGIGLRTPRHYHSEMDSNPGLDKVAGLERYLNRVPGWAVTSLLSLLTRLGGRSKRRYMLLIEDLAPARVGDQVAGCGKDVAIAVVRALGSMHANWWESPRRESLPWIVPANFLAPMFQKLLARQVDPFLTVHGTEHPLLRELIPAVQERAVAILSRLAEPPVTLLHGDFRLDNMCLSGDGSATEITVFDWQTMLFGRGVFDLAYFVTGNVSLDEATAAEPAIVETYHAALVAGGVTGYDLTSCRLDYEIAKLSILWRMTAIESGILDLGQARGVELIRVWMQRMVGLVPADWRDVLAALD